jgi:hypothetical protein
MTNRARLSASVDAELLVAGRIAVDEGRAENLSAWVNAALQRQADHDRRMTALDRFLHAYEAEHGEITDDEIGEATRRAQSRAVIVRTPPPKAKPASTRRKRGAA